MGSVGAATGRIVGAYVSDRGLLGRFGRALIAAGVIVLGLDPVARAQFAADGARNPGVQVALAPAPATDAAQAAPAGPRAAEPASGGASARSPWLAPLAGLAAGLGLVALSTRLGLGTTLAPVLMLVLLGGLATAVVVAIGARRSRAAAQLASAASELWQGIGGPSYAPRPPTTRVFDTRSVPTEPRTLAPMFSRPPGPRRPFGVPEDFDTPGFLSSAKRSFVRLQSAWDRSDLQELSECSTDDMFNALTHELRVRVGASLTDVVALEAALLGIETAAGEHRASVRFSGTLKINGEAERLDEVWNLAKPIDGPGGWLLAGIQQLN